MIITTKSVERFESKRLSNTEKKTKSSKKGKKYFPPKSRFNPNDYSLDDWMALGLSVKQSQSILNFVQRGIYSNSALEKIYVMPTEVYDLIKDSTYYEKQITEFTVIKDSVVKPLPLWKSILPVKKI